MVTKFSGKYVEIFYELVDDSEEKLKISGNKRNIERNNERQTVGFGSKLMISAWTGKFAKERSRARSWTRCLLRKISDISWECHNFWKRWGFWKQDSEVKNCWDNFMDFSRYRFLQESIKFKRFLQKCFKDCSTNFLSVPPEFLSPITSEIPLGIT